MFVISIIIVFVGLALPAFKNNFNNLELSSCSKKLQALFIYLHEQAIVEREVIYFSIDPENKKCWAKIAGEEGVLYTYSIPPRIEIETEQQQIAFYPDGTIDKVTISLKNSANQVVKLTTKGVFGGLKIEAQ